MNDFEYPPWTIGPGETPVSFGPGFSACRKAIVEMEVGLKGHITEQTCSMSKEWGNIVRAKILFAHNGSTSNLLLTCWSRPGPGVSLMTMVDCC